MLKCSHHPRVRGIADNQGSNVTFESAGKANQYTVKDEKSKEGNSLSANKPKDGGAKSPSRIIARLKRDASTDPQAEALLGKAYRQASSDRKKPSTATLPLERGEVLAKGG